MCWDADFRYIDNQFEYWEFKGTKWNHRKKEEKKQYLENAYRVLLTRARQGMIIYIPNGDRDDETRKPEFYNETY
ncbi:MAG: DNA/RNA helicase domain-containing protein, partial [Methylococcaceae bacterium]